MDKLTSGKYVIKSIFGTTETKMKRFSKPYGVSSRHSDALAVCLEGECTYAFSHGKEFTVRRGDVLYLAKGDSYLMNVTSDVYDVIFTDFEFDGDEEDRHSEVFTLPSVSSVEGAFTTLCNLSADDLPQQMSLLYSVYGRICAGDREAEGGRHSLHSSKEMIDKRFADYQLSVSSLAEGLGISAVYFRRLFAERYGTSPSKYIASVRISHAKKLLRYSYLTLSECAAECGYSSAQYFCRAFKEATGMTPNEYRKKKFRGT